MDRAAYPHCLPDRQLARGVSAVGIFPRTGAKGSPGGVRSSADDHPDVQLPTTDRRQLLLTRYTQPEPVVGLLIEMLGL
jgi:hypothetical protein